MPKEIKYTGQYMKIIKPEEVTRNTKAKLVASARLFKAPRTKIFGLFWLPHSLTTSRTVAGSNLRAGYNVDVYVDKGLMYLKGPEPLSKRFHDDISPSMQFDTNDLFIDFAGKNSLHFKVIDSKYYKKFSLSRVKVKHLIGKNDQKKHNQELASILEGAGFKKVS